MSIKENPLTPAEAFPSATFSPGDEVKLKPDYYDVSRIHKRMIGVKYIVKKCYYSSVGNMLAEVLYLETKAGVMNPYLAEYFEKIENDT